MITKNINYENFKIKINKKKQNILKEKFKFKRLLLEYPFLKSLTSDYKYSYKKNILKNFKKYSKFNLIGIGGSILGAESIYDFLSHKIKKKFSFFNNLQNYSTKRSLHETCNIIISKSGNTLETFSNLNFILSKQRKKNKNLIITEDKTNILTSIANKIKSEVIEHKNYIGGRYSVLSEVGMLPAELMGLNEKKFKRFNQLIKDKRFINKLIVNVLSIENYIKKGKKNSVILNFDEKSDNLFKWYQQLIGESLGKNGKGFFPIVSTMPKDNHSLLQLYLDGPKNNFFTFFIVKDKNSFTFNNSYLVNEIKYLKGKKINEVIYAQKYATQRVFKEKEIPFRSFEITNRNEETLGELFTFFILETLMLSSLLKVNPTNQPSVESIKIETQKILK